MLFYALRGGSYDVVTRQEEAIAVWWAVALGWATGVLPRFRRPKRSAVPLIALAALAAWTAIGLSWTGSDSRTLAEVARDLHYLGLVVLVWSLFGEDNWRAAAAGIVAAAAAVCALAITSRLMPSAFGVNEIKTVLKTYRLSYPFNYWNAVSAWAGITFAMLLAVSAHAQRAWLRAACVALLPLCAATAYLTYSRQSVLGFGTALVVVVAISRNRWTATWNALAGAVGAAIAIAVIRQEPAIVDAVSGQGGGRVAAALCGGGALAAALALAGQRARVDRARLPRRTARAVLAGTALLILLLTTTVAQATITDGWAEFRGTKIVESRSNDPAARFGSLNGGRYEHWRDAVKAFQGHPVEGIGAGTFEFWWSRQRGSGFVRDAHSLYFESLAEIGAVGFALVVAFLAGMLACAVRRRRSLRAPADVGLHVALVAAFAVFVAHAAVDWVWETTAIATLAIAGIALAAAGGHEGARARLPVRTLVVALAAVAMLVEVPNLASTSLIRASQSAFGDSNVAVAAARAEDAVHAAPWSADAYMQRAVVFEAQDRLGAAAADLEHAEQQEPVNWRPPLLRARVEAERGRVRAALRAYRSFRQLRPNSMFGPPGS